VTVPTYHINIQLRFENVSSLATNFSQNSKSVGHRNVEAGTEASEAVSGVLLWDNFRYLVQKLHVCDIVWVVWVVSVIMR
jgi:hypothetical protein